MANKPLPLKPIFIERMKMLLTDNGDFEKFEKIIYTSPRNFIRCNTLKMPVDGLMSRLSKRWNVSQPFASNPEIMLVGNDLAPGELGSSVEHLLGYYYIQEVSSMLSAIALSPKEGEIVLDVCASPGSKTTQMAAMMNNGGTLIANEISLNRLKILAANAERCGVSNVIATRNDGVSLCERFTKQGILFDKILLDAPCSGEGTLRSSKKAFIQWNHNMIESFSRQQKKLLASALNCLKEGGEIVYSTCTHGPEENEEVIDFALKNFDVEVEELILPIKGREGVTSWKGKEFDAAVKKACRIYPQDNDSEGFFLCKMRLNSKSERVQEEKEKDGI